MTSMGMHSEQVMDLDLMAMIQEQVNVVGWALTAGTETRVEPIVSLAMGIIYPGKYLI